MPGGGRRGGAGSLADALAVPPCGDVWVTGPGIAGGRPAARGHRSCRAGSAQCRPRSQTMAGPGGFTDAASSVPWGTGLSRGWTGRSVWPCHHCLLLVSPGTLRSAGTQATPGWTGEHGASLRAPAVGLGVTASPAGTVPSRRLGLRNPGLLTRHPCPAFLPASSPHARGACAGRCSFARPCCPRPPRSAGTPQGVPPPRLACAPFHVAFSSPLPLHVTCSLTQCPCPERGSARPGADTVLVTSEATVVHVSFP